MAALVLASLIPLAAVVAGVDWWVTVGVAMASVFVPAGVARSLGAPTWTGSVVGFLTWVVVLVVLFAPASAVLGVVPTLATVDAFHQLAVAAGQSIYEQSIPVDPVQPLLFVLAVAVGAIAVLLDVVGVSLRSPALAGIAAIGVLLPPSIFTGSVDLVAYALTGAVYLWVLRLDRPRVRSGRTSSSSGAAVAVGASALAVTIVAATLVPGFSSRSLVQPDGDTSFGSGVSALADLGRDLQRPGNSPHFSYQTSTTEHQYLRLLTLDRFEGTRWTSSGDHPTVAQDDATRVDVPGLTEQVSAEEATVDIEITGLVGELLPVPFPSVAVSGLRGEWEWDTEGLTVSSPSSSVDGQEYSVTSLVLAPTADQLRGAPDDYPAEVAAFLDLPSDVPAAIRTAFDEVTAGAATRYDRAYAIQQYLRTEFSYSEATPVDDGYDGDGFEAIARFLEAGSGYCVHFASAMAILSRMAGIPARVSLGYLPGDRVGSDDDGMVAYRVGSDDLHAWPELYFAGIGWVPFEPTPGRGVVPSYAFEAGSADDQDDVPDDPATALPDEEPTPTATPGSSADALAGNGDDASTGATALVGVLLTAVVLLLLAAPAGARALRRRRRWAAVRAGRGAGIVAWDELVDAAADLGHDIRAGDSERDLAARLRGTVAFDEDTSAALDVALRVREAERYAPSSERARPPGSPDPWTSVDRVVNALREDASLLRRVGAVVAPASVLSRPGAVGVRPARTG
jgi:transglutaminase-like putative cysteine protease